MDNGKCQKALEKQFLLQFLLQLANYMLTNLLRHNKVL